MGEAAGIASAIITGGVGAALGSIGTALIQTVSRKNVSRAEAADRVTNAAGNLADRLDRTIAQLDKDNALMRQAIVAITDVMDEVVPLIADPQVRERAHSAISAARLVLR